MKPLRTSSASTALRRVAARTVRCRGLALASLLAWLIATRVALAGGVVGTGTPGTCTEAALDAALAGGGSVTFNCGASPVTITVTSAKTIATATSLDGAGLVTLSGGGTTQLFVINSKRVTLTLANVAVSDGVATGASGGAIANKGTLSVANSTFANNSAANAAGVSGGYGGAVINWGVLSVTNSIFANNSVSPNDAATGGWGGAIFNLGTASVAGSTFLSNSSASPFGGGAVFNMNKLSVTNSTFANNTSPNGSGGAIYNIGVTLSVTNSTFTNNSAALTGGAIQHNTGGTGKLTVVSCTFTGNNGAAVGGAMAINGPATVTNSTFAGNSAGAGGGAIYNLFDKLTVISSTFSNNTSLDGAGAAIDNDGGTASLKNTIIATTTTDENCLGQGNLVTDKGHNIDSGASCGFSHTHGSLSRTDPQLDPAGLADNGGPTQTVAVDAGSPAVNAGNEGACKAAPVKGVDQRGFVRPGSGSTRCTIGAYEFNSLGPRTGGK